MYIGKVYVCFLLMYLVSLQYLFIDMYEETKGNVGYLLAMKIILISTIMIQIVSVG